MKFGGSTLYRWSLRIRREVNGYAVGLPCTVEVEAEFWNEGQAQQFEERVRELIEEFKG